MKYFLEGGFTICQELVHSLAGKAASTSARGRISKDIMKAYEDAH